MDRNGYFSLVNKEDGIYLKCVDAIDKGAPVNVNDVIGYLDTKLVKNYDVKAINEYLLKRNFAFDMKVSSQKGYRQNEYLKLDIDENGLKVIGRFYPPSNDGEKMSKTDIINELKHHGIMFGYVIRNIEIFVRARLYCTDILLAKAEPPVHGHNASIEYYFKTDAVAKPKLNDDGSVDFHQLGNISHVNAGDKLAHLTPEDPGKPGTNIYGKPIPAKKVERKILRYGINISVSEDGCDMYADVCGHATLVGDTVYVSDVYEVPANVDTATGDIDYNGNVMVRGNVNTGYTVKAAGDIIINGVVEGATLIAGGDIIVGLGVQGIFKAKLKAGGNIVSKFFENCEEICADGTVSTDAIMHSNVKAKGEITVKGKRGLITGGSIISGCSIRAKTAGSTMGTQTKIEIGIEPGRMEKYYDYEKEIALKNEEIERMKQTLAVFQKRIMNREKLAPDKMRQIQETNELYKSYCDDIEKCKKKMADIVEELEICKNGRIYISGSTYSGVTITIASVRKKIDDEAIHTCYIKDGADIRLASF